MLITSGALAKALGVDGKTVWNAVERGDPRFAGFGRTPGGGKNAKGQLRWPVARAAEIVRAQGLPVPEDWKQGHGYAEGWMSK